MSAPGPTQRIYVGALEVLGGRLYGFSPAGAQQGLCSLSLLATPEASPVVLTGGGAAFYSNGVRALVSLLPGAAPACLSKATSFDVSFPGNLVADADTVYFRFRPHLGRDPHWNLSRHRDRGDHRRR